MFYLVEKLPAANNVGMPKLCEEAQPPAEPQESCVSVCMQVIRC